MVMIAGVLKQKYAKRMLIRMSSSRTCAATRKSLAGKDHFIKTGNHDLGVGN
jgi:hypothetical protein